MVVYKPRDESEWEPGKYVERGIQYLGPRRFRALVRERGVDDNKVFDTLKEAQDWRKEKLGTLVGKKYVDSRLAERTTLAEACTWGLSINPDTGRAYMDKGDANFKNHRARLRYWMEKSRFRNQTLTGEVANGVINGIHDFSLMRWVNDLMAVDVGDDVEDAEAAALELAKLEGYEDGPLAPVKPQTIAHRLTTLSVLYQEWRRHHSLKPEQCPNPVGKALKPPVEASRRKARRLKEGEFEQLLETARASNRPWLPDAIIIAVETGMRQTELATLDWDHVFLDSQHPHVHLIKTKNGEERRPPLSPEAITAFRRLKEMADKHNADRRERIKRSRTDNSRAHAMAVPTWDTPLPIESGRGIIHAFRDAVDFARERAQLAGDPGWALIHDDLRWHDLRHEAVSRLFELTDMRDQEVMEIVGHLSKEMLKHYLKLRTERLGAKLPGAKKAAEVAAKEAEARNDKPGAVRLGRGVAPAVMDADGQWVPFDEADEVIRAYAIKAVKLALADLAKLTEADAEV